MRAHLSEGVYSGHGISTLVLAGISARGSSISLGILVGIGTHLGYTWDTIRCCLRWMHARLSTTPCQQTSKRASSSTALASSPIARFSLAPSSTNEWEKRSRRTNPGLSTSSRGGQTFPQRKSICEPIREEPSNSASEIISDLAALEELEVYKRQHRPRSKPTRTQSAPLLISTNTTQPVYINHKSPRYIHLHHLPIDLTSISFAVDLTSSS